MCEKGESDTFFGGKNIHIFACFIFNIQFAAITSKNISFHPSMNSKTNKTYLKFNYEKRSVKQQQKLEIKHFLFLIFEKRSSYKILNTI